jgi:Holliday junction resolvase-like predicted endonuclease
MTGYVLNTLNARLMEKFPLDVQRMPSFYPSSASCVDEMDKETVHGACLRAQWYRCMQYEESNPSGLYSQYIFAAGNLLEKFLADKLRETGIVVGTGVKFSIPERYISGELDIVIKDHDGGLAIVENKTYSSANYAAKKEICGSKDSKPKPKMQNLIQSFLYQHAMQDQVNRTYLTYLDRACGSPDNNKEFEITVHVDARTEKSYPRIKTTDFDGSPYEYIEKSISMEGIFARFDSLMTHLQEQRIPVGDFRHTLSSSEIDARYESGEITKYKYENYVRNPDKNPIGDWNCSYCSYSDTCKAQKKIDGHK